MLISGEPRGIVFKEQIQFFTSLYNSLVKDGHILDTYCMFKLNPTSDYIQSEEGLQNFSEILELFKPMYLEFFYDIFLWLKEYHQRSHSESFHSAFKRDYGVVRKVNYAARFVQITARIILHNFIRLSYFNDCN